MSMNLRTVTTERSVWIFDLDNMRYMRMPAQEAPIPSMVPYDGEWDEFTRLEDLGNGRMMVHRPVPFGEGCLRQTGVVTADTGEGHWPKDEDQ